MKDRKINMGKATKVYIYIYIYIYLHIFIFTFNYLPILHWVSYRLCNYGVFIYSRLLYTEDFHSKSALPGYLPFVIYNLLLLTRAVCNAVIYIDYNTHFVKLMMGSPLVS